MLWRERVKTAVLDAGLGFSYGHNGDHTTNCVRLWYAILLALFGPGIKKLSDAIHIAPPYQLGSFANIDGLIEGGFAEEVDYPVADGGVYVAQGWYRNSSNALRGHMFGVMSPTPGPWSGTEAEWMIIEANTRPDWYRPIGIVSQSSKYTDGIRWVRLLDPYNP